jgi:methyl-accepting chemotaxis protein
MNILSNLKIGTRLGLAFATLVGLLLLMAVAAVGQAGRLQGNTEYYESNVLPSMKIIADFYEGASDARRTTFLLITLSDPEEIKKVEARFAKEVEVGQKALDTYEQQDMFYDDKDKQLWAAAKASLQAWRVSHDKVLELNRKRLSDPTQADAARTLMLGDARVVNLALIKAKTDWESYNDDIAKEVTLRGRATYRAVLWILGGVTTLAVLVGLVAAVAITRSITRPLADALRVTQAVASGDLTQHLHSDARDELGDLLNSLDQMSINLSQMVRSVREGTEAIATASAEIAQGNSDLSSRTEQQAANLQQTAASMDQMTGTVKSNSDNARAASDLSIQASDVAARGGQAVSQVVETMGRIQDSSRKIADIISVIDGIAFQTNILALNAAVEAARAGEQGRGFAVVASEVRSLAQRSAQAAKEINGLITDSVDKVETGTRQVNSAGITIREAVDQVRKVSELISDITRSSTEQSTGVDQINTAVNQLDQATQQNAALVEETAAAAESLRQQAERLSQAVAVFRISASTASPRSPN